MPRKKPKSAKRSDPHAAREARDYDNPIASREHIIAQLADNGPLDFRGLVKQLAIKGEDSRQALRKRLRAMQRDGQVLCNRAEEYGVVNKMDLLRGRVEAHRDGFGFVLQEHGGDIYLSANEMRRLFHGDEVLVSIAGENRRGQLEGKVAEIIARGITRVVGRLKKEAGGYFVVPDNPRIAHDILIDAADRQKARPGEYVTVEIRDYPDWHNRATGIVIEVLGEPMAPGLEIDIAIRSHALPYEFPDAALAEAERLGDAPEEADKKHRVDLRRLPLVTIDGEDARDFDDAVYCEPGRRGSFRLWVAIADVAHYVPVDSSLDAEGFQRGNSVYFPGRVVPMLPEQISNGLCSLNPQVDRLCMVAEMHISASGELKSYEFYEGVMHSHARLTYTEVAEALGLIDRPPRAGLMQRIEPVMPHLENLQRLFRVLRKRRNKRGAIDFDTVETQIVFDEKRKIDAIVPVERNDAHKIIEECMLCANVAAAGLLDASGLDALYRVHEGPKPEKLLNLRSYLGEMGLSLAGGDKPTPLHYQKLMQQIADRPDAHLIQVMLLRSLSQAVYDPENNGHFGLAYDAYAHFTSPIRRYPDLLVHRAIKHLVHSRKRCKQVKRVRGGGTWPREEIYPYDKSAMLAHGAHCSMTERRADDATRDVMAFLKCEYLLEHIGGEFDGVVAGVTGFGMFVELTDLYVEGLVHISSLGSDYFHFEPAMQRLVGERTRKIYQLGDSVRVSVAAVDMEQRKVDLALAGSSAAGDSKRGAKRARGGKRGAGASRSGASKPGSSKPGAKKTKRSSSGKTKGKPKAKSKRGGRGPKKSR
ncbi:MAG: ribonuclease R [Gammaproteobacteria bacterium]|nr:ribonuclease R [Gammaproteobacteria bacterium]NND39356.1 ribonuclease R [Pseudomonadales bacterium]MBT8151304.1 ribonuclease R [Gammaproteobacteria bacterium]NNL10451.1 ribonuclease R [Pseudomonadales bacterium]NNM10503.1 ribonuclease R [Pseudomonadales bacterium]